MLSSSKDHRAVTSADAAVVECVDVSRSVCHESSSHYYTFAVACVSSICTTLPSVTGSDSEVSKLRKAVAEDHLKRTLRPFMNRYQTAAAAAAAAGQTHN